MSPTKQNNKTKLEDFSPSYQKALKTIMKKHPDYTFEQVRQENYENRIRKAAAKNPDVSLNAARGHKAKPLPKEATPLQHQTQALREKASNLKLKEKVGILQPAQVKEAQKILRKMSSETKKMQQHEGEVIGGLSSLEWTKWSQEQKQREVQARELLAQLTPEAAAKAQKILEKMKLETEKMWTMRTRRPGTTGYYKAQARMKALYKRLEKLGLVNRTGDLVAGEVGYH